MNNETKKEPIKLPSLLSFERKLETSDGLMYSGNWEDRNKDYLDDKKEVLAWEPIKITKRQNRSTQSASGIDDDKKSMPNPASSNSDDANLPMDKNTLKLCFTIRVIGNLGKPFACNEPVFENGYYKNDDKGIVKKVNKFKKDNLVQELAKRYSYNIANGRFLWRNRVCAEKVKIYVNDDISFNAYDFSLNNFDKNSDDNDLIELSNIIEQGLLSDNDYNLIKVTAYVKLGDGQHVFPSQEMNMGEDNKVLFQLDKCAAMHNVKIGNAIRTIDDWYDNAEFPIAVEPFGSVTQRGQAYRKSTNDLYTLMQNWVNDTELTSNDKYFVVANLIRGGVFSGKKKK